MTASSLTAAMFSTVGMQQVFSEQNTVQCMLEFEAALAVAEAREDVIPQHAVGAIVACCDATRMDLNALAESAGLAGNLAIPLVKQLTAQVALADVEAAKFVHWGATSQDVIDTGMVLQLRQALDLISMELAELADAVAQLAHRHRSTPLMGRTWMQHALPVTFGLKAAGWLDALLRHQERLAQLRSRLFVLQFGGAAGTLASLGNRGLTVASALAHALDLTLPAIPWHTQRDRIAETATVLGLLTGSLGKIARDIALHSQTEVAELAEPVMPGRGGSSTMPHKRNPVGCAAALTAALRVPALVSTMLSGMVQEQERALGGWQAEWDTLPEIACLCGAALSHMRQVVSGLSVDTVQMRTNIDLTRGLVMAESVSLTLGEQMGRLAAHQLVEQACQQALTSKLPLLQVLMNNETVRAQLSVAQLEQCFDPLTYTGEAEAFVDRVLAAHQLRKSVTTHSTQE
jgi:3-carboxy-cis,cis-muconate cycloisomerase